MSVAGTRRVAITGCGTVNAAFVGGVPELSTYLEHPESRVRAEPSTEPGLVASVDDRALDGLTDAGDQRRVSRISRFAIAAARLALADADAPPEDLSLVVGTELGDLRSTKEFANGFLERGPTGLSALLFPNTVMNTMAAATAIAVQARAATLTLNAPVVAGELAIARAAAGIAAGRFELALAGGVDQIEPITELAAGGEARGEGATFLVLEPLEKARQRGARVFGEITGWGWRALNAPPCGVGRAEPPRAVLLALERAGLAGDAVRWVYDSATLDRERDDWERALLDVAFPHHPRRVSLGRWLGRHGGLGALSVAGAAWSACAGRLPAIGGAMPADRGVGLVHGVARGGTHVALVVGAPLP